MQKIRANPMIQVACLTGILALLIAALVGSRSTVARAEERTKSGLRQACASSGAVNAARLPARVALDDCDLVGRTVVSGVVAVTVPPPGRGVGAAAVGENGESELYVTTSPSGVVTISEENESEATSSAAAEALLGPGFVEPCDEEPVTPGCLPPCEANGAATFDPRARVKKGQPWKFKESSTPGTLTTAQALAAIKGGTKNVVNATNTCGMADNVDQTSAYKGTTTGGTGINVQGGTNNCKFPGNSKNVVDFGPLMDPTIGLACTLTQKIGNNPWFIVEADIRFKESTLWTTTPDAKDCPVDTYDLRGVVVHERGHAFGLKHPSDAASNKQLTMYFQSFQCSSYARTLGKGDVRGLNLVYN